MEIGINDLSHAVRIMSGFEAYANGESGSDVIYAKTCLRLNGLNLDSYKGTEGFLDGIKAGGAKMIEMIVKFLKAVKNFFFGALGIKRDKAVKEAATHTEKMITDIDKQLKELAKQTGGTSEQLDAAINQTERFIAERKVSMQERKAYSIENWSDYVKRFSEGIWCVEIDSVLAGGVPGVSLKINDGRAVSSELNTNLARLKTQVSALDGKVENGTKLVKDLQNFTPLLTTLGKVREGAKTLLANAVKDLENNNEIHKKLNDGTYNINVNALRALNAETSLLIDRMTKLIAICERDIATIEGGVGVIAKKVKVEDIPTSSLEEFDKFMSE